VVDEDRLCDEEKADQENRYARNLEPDPSRRSCESDRRSNQHLSKEAVISNLTHPPGVQHESEHRGNRSANDRDREIFDPGFGQEQRFRTRQPERLCQADQGGEFREKQEARSLV